MERSARGPPFLRRAPRRQRLSHRRPRDGSRRRPRARPLRRVHRRLVGALRQHGLSSPRHHSFITPKILPKLAARLRLQKQDALVILASVSDSIAVLAALHHAQLPLHVLGGPAWEDAAPPPGPATRSLFVVAEFFPADPAAARFVRDYRATYGEPPTKAAARGADAATVAIHAVELSLSRGIDVATALRQLELTSLAAGTYSRGSNRTFTLVEITPLGPRFVRRITTAHPTP